METNSFALRAKAKMLVQCQEDKLGKDKFHVKIDQ